MTRKKRDYAKILEGKPVPGDKEPWDLDLLVRQVLVGILADRDLSENAAAKAAGVDQRTLNRFMLGEGMRLETLAKLCHGFETTPIRFLDSHPEVGRNRPAVRIARDQVYDRFRTVFTPQEQDHLLNLVEEIRNLGLYNVAVATLRGIVEASKIGRRRGLREKRTAAQGETP